MKNIHNLINQLQEEENQWRSTEFIAPCLLGGKIRVKVTGLVREFV